MLDKEVREPLAIYTSPTLLAPNIIPQGNPIHISPHIKLGVPLSKLVCELYFTLEVRMIIK